MMREKNGSMINEIDYYINLRILEDRNWLYIGAN